METTECPLCRTPLELKQISFTAAIYLCTDLKCPYPVNEKCLVVERHLEGPKNNFGGRTSVKQSGNLEHTRPVMKPEKSPDGGFDLNEAVSHALESFDLQTFDGQSFVLGGNVSCNNNVATDNDSFYNNEYNQAQSNGNHNQPLSELEEIFNGFI